MQKFSAFELFRQGLSGQTGWKPQWRSPEPKQAYDAVIIGGGGHGLGAAYYLAKQHGLRNIAVLEKGWIGGGNTGRNTTIIRSNYLFDESAGLYDHSVKLWEGLSQELNYNVMFSQRGVLMLAHTVHDVQVFKRHVHANRANGVDNEWLTAEEAKAYCPPLNISNNMRYPVLGGALQRRGGTARHDAVAWGYARGADALGVDIIENCEVTAIRRSASGAVQAVETTRGVIRTPKIGVSAAGHTSMVLGMAGAISASATASPYDRPSVDLPIAATNRFATRSPSPVFTNLRASQKTAAPRRRHERAHACASAAADGAPFGEEEGDDDEPDDLVSEGAERLRERQRLGRDLRPARRRRMARLAVL